MRFAGSFDPQKEDGEAVRDDRYIFCPHAEDAQGEATAPDGVPEHLLREIEQFFFDVGFPHQEDQI